MDVLHLLVGRMIVTMFLICGVWGLLAYFGRLKAGGGYYSTLVLAEVLAIVQFAAGAILLLLGRMPPDPLHLAYGSLAALVLPIAYGYANRNGWSLPLTCGLATLFVFGLGIRAFTTSVVGFAGLFGAIAR